MEYGKFSCNENCSQRFFGFPLFPNLLPQREKSGEGESFLPEAVHKREKMQVSFLGRSELYQISRHKHPEKKVSLRCLKMYQVFQEGRKKGDLGISRFIQKSSQKPAELTSHLGPLGLGNQEGQILSDIFLGSARL